MKSTKPTFKYTNRGIGDGISLGINYRLDGLTAQAAMIVRHMAKAGSITLREAMADHSVQSLTRRITEIKSEGIAVHTVSSKHPITGQRYSRYSLVKPSRVAL